MKTCIIFSHFVLVLSILVKVKNKITSDFHIPKIWQILKRFAGTFQETQISNF